MKTLAIKIYEFDELDEEAKEKAREWWREGLTVDHWWHESVTEDADEIAKLMGIEIDRQDRNRKSTRPAIWFSGFSSQGDGACFDGYYSYRKGSVKKLKEYAGTDKELHRIAEGLYLVQADNFFQLQARVRPGSGSNHYSHEMTRHIDVYRRDGTATTEGAEDAVSDLLRDFMRWIYKQLESEWDYMNSDEQVDEAIESNGYTFTEHGKRMG